MKDALLLTKEGFTLVPLNENPEDKFYRKRPRDKGWRTLKYSLSDLQASFRRTHAIGARVPAGVCVIDVDVKEGKVGLQSLAKFPQANLMDGSYVTTGSGGLHIYFRLPPGITKVASVIRELKDIDFRHEGYQVVAPGSLNIDGNPYVWDDFTKETGIVDIPEMPKDIWDFLCTFDKWLPKEDDGSRVYQDAISGDELTTLLESINIEDYKQHDEWLKVMMAAHEASGGGGIDQFYDWCQKDPDASLRVSRSELEKRWKSIDSNASDGITRRYLEMIAAPKARAVVDFGPENTKRHNVPLTYVTEKDAKRTMEDARNSVKNLVSRMGTDQSLDLMVVDDFDEDDFGDGSIAVLSDSLLAGPLSALNKEFALLIMGGKSRVARESINMYGQKEWDFWEVNAFHNWLANKPKMQVIKGDQVVLEDISQMWIDWPERRQYNMIDFYPGLSQEEVDKQYPGTLNLWTSWGVEPEYVPQTAVAGEYCEPPAMCSQFTELVRSLSGSEKRGEAEHVYFMNWLAYGFYKVDEPPGVAVAMRGKKGIGKGQLGNILRELTGNMFLSTSKMEQVTGKFNGTVRNVAFLLLDEALWSGSKAEARQLQSIVTEPFISTEIKGMQPLTTRNCLHILLASNDHWVVPASGDDERRYCVFDSSAEFKYEQEFWLRLRRDFGLDVRGTAYSAEVKERLSALLGWLIARGQWLHDNGWKPQWNIPQTKALQEQKEHSKDPYDSWFEEAIEFGVLGTVNLEKAFTEWSRTTRGKELIHEDEVKYGAIRKRNPEVARQMLYKSKLDSKSVAVIDNLGTGFWVWNEDLKNDFLSSEFGVVAERTGKYEHRSISTLIGKCIVSKLPRSIASKKVVPKEDRDRVTSFSAKFQANATYIDFRDLKKWLEV